MSRWLNVNCTVVSEDWKISRWHSLWVCAKKYILGDIQSTLEDRPGDILYHSETWVSLCMIRKVITQFVSWWKSPPEFCDKIKYIKKKLRTLKKPKPSTNDYLDCLYNFACHTAKISNHTLERSWEPVCIVQACTHVECFKYTPRVLQIRPPRSGEKIQPHHSSCGLKPKIEL